MDLNDRPTLGGCPSGKRLIDYVVVCGLDLNNGLEPDSQQGKAAAAARPTAPTPQSDFGTCVRPTNCSSPLSFDLFVCPRKPTSPLSPPARLAQHLFFRKSPRRSPKRRLWPPNLLACARVMSMENGRPCTQAGVCRTPLAIPGLETDSLVYSPSRQLVNSHSVPWRFCAFAPT
ncbi:hypothetical protein BIW11_07681 [Tropilaelaps mercedesae]|uniref:Uncharacterized protein n=1 Tax=Tropilaelaps mercedesae TaxID=418985 RepID=A0A1V9XSX3_9ACAR|nr:hypothetical protein BIW11_07681 [Tropilaelaps mercedesae]